MMCFSFSVLAEELSLEEVWRIISDASQSQHAAQLRYEATAVAKTRASYHWLPQIYLDAKTYATDDPALTFMGILSERSVSSDDFNPSFLNHPGNHVFNRAALGIDWPLYEGGMKVAEVALRDHYLASSAASMKQVQTQQYTEVARNYGSLGSLANQKNKLVALQKIITRILENYKIGNQINPVGYSGLLGLKNLNNRLQGLLIENQAKTLAIKDELAVLGLKERVWTPKKWTADSFVDRYFPKSHRGDSANVVAHKQAALAEKKRIQIEQAKYLPKIGAYAEEAVFNGNRNTSSAYTVGLYLRWNIFNPSDYHVAKEVQLNAMAADFQANSFAEKERAETTGISEALSAIRLSLKLMQESETLLDEQVKISSDLFQKGSISGLQLAEVFARRLELSVNHTEAEISLLNLAAKQSSITNFSLPSTVVRVGR